jgi:hypothetical protein
LASRQRQLSKHGLNWESEEAILKEQGGVCAVCGGDKDRKSWDIDHDHHTGVVRGLLCGRCNKGLGLLGDNVEGVQKALEYLQSPPAPKVIRHFRKKQRKALT